MVCLSANFPGLAAGARFGLARCEHFVDACNDLARTLDRPLTSLDLLHEPPALFFGFLDQIGRGITNTIGHDRHPSLRQRTIK
jgi:hypothetical protein